MLFRSGQWLTHRLLAGLLFITFFYFTLGQPYSAFRHRSAEEESVERIVHPGFFKPKFRWRDVQEKHPVDSFTALPTGSPVSIPRIQHRFSPESPDHSTVRKRRLNAVKETFQHSWKGYKKNAWLHDEVSPLTGSSRNPFGGWGATLVDSLDTLWIMGMKKEFERAVSALKHIDFNTSPQQELNVFETTIRYLGGLLSAYDVSGQQYSVLLHKAVELGDMLYLAFDTPNRLPVTRWDWQKKILGKEQQGKKSSLLAEVGSLTLEFTRLSRLTGNPKWYDAIARVTDVFERSQNHTKIPGLWPTFVDAKKSEFTDNTFTLGGMADSMYEYLPKQHIMLGGQSEQYRSLYLTALPAAKRHLFFQPLNPANESLLLSGTVTRWSATNIKLAPEGEHLACFAGGMVALAAKVFEQDHELETARELVDGCLWSYSSMPSGIMPEVFSTVPCYEKESRNCGWDEDAWRRAVVQKVHGGNLPDNYAAEAQTVISERNLAPGFTDIKDARYILRPEAIESVFILYRITGDWSLQERAWAMFEAIREATKTSIAHAGLKDVRQMGSERELLDNMESFWTAETLKYFYLMFSDPDVISLDKYVLNTEAHPLLRPT